MSNAILVFAEAAATVFIRHEIALEMVKKIEPIE